MRPDPSDFRIEGSAADGNGTFTFAAFHGPYSTTEGVLLKTQFRYHYGSTSFGACQVRRLLGITLGDMTALGGFVDLGDRLHNAGGRAFRIQSIMGHCSRHDRHHRLHGNVRAGCGCRAGGRFFRVCYSEEFYHLEIRKRAGLGIGYNT
jgi:hypothetical protein